MNAKKDYRVGVAIHSYGPIHPLVYANHIGVFASWHKVCSIKLLHIDGVKTAGARCMLVKKAIDEDCTHILFIDADHIISDDLLPTLLSNAEAADVVSGLVVKKDGRSDQVGFLERKDGKFFQIALPCDGLSYDVGRCAFGCTLINLDVFKDMEKPYFQDTVERDSEGVLQQHRSDMVFCRAVKKQGRNIRIDTRARIGHIGVPEIHFPKDIQYQLHTYRNAVNVAKLLASEGADLSCVDYGCGLGRKLFERIEPVCPKIVGIDREGRIKTCIKRYPDSEIVWRVEDLEKPIKDLGMFGLAICADVLEHLHKPKILLATILEHLGDNGYVVISTPDYDTLSKDIKNPSHNQFWNEKQFVALLEDNGLEIGVLKREEEVTGYISMIAICRRATKDDKGSN